MHGHSGSHQHGGGDPRSDRRRLAVALAVVLTVLVVEGVGGILTGSLALLSDAGHMASAAIGLAVALVASAVGARPATARHTYGFRRAEVLAALVNGVLLTVIAVSVAVEAMRRLLPPQLVEVLATAMLVVALLGDLIGSVFAVAAAIVLLVFDFGPADAVVSLPIAALIAPRALLLLRDVARVLTESAPRETDVASIRAHLLDTAGVVDVHDVHVWAITSGAPVFSAHVVVSPAMVSAGGTGELLDRLGEGLSGHFDVAHSTFQLEPTEHAAHEEGHHR